MGRAMSNFFLTPPPGEGSKGQISFNFNYKVSKGAKIRNRYNQVPHLTQDTNGKVIFFKDFYTKLCVCPHKRKIQNISDRIFISVAWAIYAPGVDFGALVVFFFKHGHMEYQINGNDEQNKMQVIFHPRVKLVTLG